MSSIKTTSAKKKGSCAHRTGLSPNLTNPQYITDCLKAVILLWFITIVTVCPLSVSYGSQLFVSFVWSSLAVICWERTALLAFLLRLIHLMLSLVFCVLSSSRSWAGC